MHRNPMGGGPALHPTGWTPSSALQVDTKASACGPALQDNPKGSKHGPTYRLARRLCGCCAARARTDLLDWMGPITGKNSQMKGIMRTFQLVGLVPHYLVRPVESRPIWSDCGAGPYVEPLGLHMCAPWHASTIPNTGPSAASRAVQLMSTISVRCGLAAFAPGRHVLFAIARDLSYCQSRTHFLIKLYLQNTVRILIYGVIGAPVQCRGIWVGCSGCASICDPPQSPSCTLICCFPVFHTLCSTMSQCLPVCFAWGPHDYSNVPLIFIFNPFNPWHFVPLHV